MLAIARRIGTVAAGAERRGGPRSLLSLVIAVIAYPNPGIPPDGRLASESPGPVDEVVQAMGRTRTITRTQIMRVASQSHS